jgi:hypothetical protein
MRFTFSEKDARMSQLGDKPFLGQQEEMKKPFLPFPIIPNQGRTHISVVFLEGIICVNLEKSKDLLSPYAAVVLNCFFHLPFHSYFGLNKSLQMQKCLTCCEVRSTIP